MPYKAARHFRVIPLGTDNCIDYKPGDYILDFASWPEHAQATHLNQNMVVPTDKEPPAISDEEIEAERAELSGKTKGKLKVRGGSAEPLKKFDPEKDHEAVLG